MNVRPILAAVLIAVGVALLGYLMINRDPVALVPLPEMGPRPPIAVDISVAKPSLLGLRPTPSGHSTGDPARIERNRLARAWIQALDALKAGRIHQGAVERLEMELWVQRVHTGEVQPQAMHEALATLFERELQRRKKLLAVRSASEDDVRHAEVLLARERYAAGDEASDYPAQRATYLDARRKHILLLARSGVMVKDVADLEIETLELELPEPHELRVPPKAL